MYIVFSLSKLINFVEFHCMSYGIEEQVLILWMFTLWNANTTYFYIFLSLFCHSSDKEQLIYILINITMRLLRKQFYMLSWNSRKRFKESLMYFSRAMWIFWKRNTTEPWQQCNGINLSNKFLIVHVVRNSTKFFYLCENIIKYTKNNKFTSFILFS